MAKQSKPDAFESGFDAGMAAALRVVDQMHHELVTYFGDDSLPAKIIQNLSVAIEQARQQGYQPPSDVDS